MICPLNHRSVVALSGNDRLKFIQGIITQDVHILSNQNPLIYGLLLSTKGRILFDLFIFENENTLYIDTDRCDDLIGFLKIYKLRSDIEIRKTDMFVYGVIKQDNLFDYSFYYKDPRHLDMGFRLYSSSKIDINGKIDDYDDYRLSLAIPDGQKDLMINKSLPLEWRMDELSAISFTKGCYLGQELTARTKHTPIIRKHATACSLDAPLYKEAVLNDNVISFYKKHAFIWTFDSLS